MKSFLCDLILTCTLTTQPGPAVDDLYYGTMLYAYYQDDYQQALLEALIAERLGRRGDDPVRFELAAGSFAFADGMYRYAAQTFAAIDPSEITPLDSMRLNFHLARERFRRGEFDQAGEALARIDLGQTWFGRERHHPEVEFMRAELAAQAGDFDAADRAIDRIDETSPFRAYALFNLGVALRAAGELSRSEEAFEGLATAPAYDTEALDLKQRAQLALAVVRRQRSAVASAETILGALPFEGRYRDLALTSYGGLAMDAGDYELAARIWMTLQNSDYWTQSTAAARIALPMSLEQMASEELALVQYRSAEQAFEARLEELDGLAARANDPAWVAGLLSAFSTPTDDGGDVGPAVERWRAELGHTDWLTWFSTERVHELLLEWRELSDVAAWLDTLPEELAIFDALTDEQQRRAHAAAQLVDSDGLRAARDRLVASVAALDAEVASLRAARPERSAAWMFELASPDERELLTELAERRTVALGLPEEARTPWLRRIDRLEGLVFWQIVDQSAARIRTLEKLARANAEILSDIDARIARVEAAEAALIAGVGADFLAFQERADAITRAVAVARTERETMLAAEIKAGMAREIQQVQHDLLVTRIAIARATDRLAMVAPPEGGP